MLVTAVSTASLTMPPAVVIVPVACAAPAASAAASRTCTSVGGAGAAGGGEVGETTTAPIPTAAPAVTRPDRIRPRISTPTVVRKTPLLFASTGPEEFES
jgi:hypothetical protein